MRTILIAAASAIFFAAVTVELSSRLWPGSYLALLLIAAIALFCNGMLSTRLAAAPTAAPTRGNQRRQANRGAGRNADAPRSRSQSSRGSRSESPRERRPAEDSAAVETPASGPREDGTVKWFNRSKGYGFIIRDNGDEIFVHQRSIRQVGEGDNRRRPALRDGQAVNFVVETRDKGAQAEDVTGTD